MIYALAALAQSAGRFAFRAWLRLGRSGGWLLPGVACPALFAYLPSRIDIELAGGAFAAYGGIHISASLAWLSAVESTLPGPVCRSLR